MKRVLFALAAVCGLLLNNYSYAQPGNLEGDVISGSWNNTQTLTDLGAFRQYRGQRTGATGNGNFLYNPAPGDYSAQWTGSNAPNFVRSLNTYHNGGAFYYTTGGWNTNLQIAMTNGNYYTWNLLENGAASSSIQILETTYNPVTFSSITSAWAANGQRTVTVTMSAAPAGGENVFCRFTTNGYAASTLVQFSFVGAVGTATIPAQAQGSNVQLYAYSSNKSSAAIGTDVGGNGQSAHDLATLNLSAGLAYTQNPVHVLSTTGTSAGVTLDYLTLKAAFDAINLGALHTGAITISILGNTTETASAVLNQVAGVTAIGIQPAGGAARSISGAIVAGSPLIDLNGADNVTIDGLNTGGNSLTISNTTNSATVATSTIQFRADATINTIQNCTISGSSIGGNSATAAGTATIYFAGATTTGNDNNIIQNNTIGAAGANLPSCAIFAYNATVSNDNIQILNNNIADVFNGTTGINSFGILVGTNNGTWTITGNKFYQAATRTSSAGTTLRGISVQAGNGYIISNNVIGFANAAGTGTTFYAGAFANRFIGIDLAVGTTTATNVQGNTISGINLTTSSGASTNNGIFTGIYVIAGNVNIGTTTGNTIGNTAATNFIFITSTTTGSLVNGISCSSTGTVNIQNNNISSLGFGGSATIGYIVNGISTAGAAGVYTISGNTIGSTTTANSIGVGVSGTTTAACTFVGINNAATGNTSITGNTLQNITTYGTGTNVLKGIENTATCATLSMSNNNLLSFSMPASTAGTFTGISNTGAVSSSIAISNNFFGNASFGLITYGAANSGALTVVSNTGGAAAATLSVQTNAFRGITYSVASSGAHIYINNTAATLSQNISSNTFTNLNVNTTGSVTFISNNVALPTGGSVTANSNSIVTAFNKGGAGGTVTLYLTTTTPSSVAGTTKSIQSNNFSNITLTGATTMAGWMDIEGATGGGSTKTISNNTFSNWNCGTGAVNVIQCQYAGGASTISTNTISSITTSANAIIAITTPSTNGGTSLTISGNTITGLSSTGTGGAVTAISNASASTTNNINGNIINTLSSTSTTATVVGITTGASSNIFSNTINTLSCVGTTSGVSNGIMVTAGTAVNVYKNKIYDLSTTGAFTTTPGVNGIVLSGSTSSATVNVYNNLIGDLKAATSASTDAIRGIAVTSIGTTSTYNVYYNTVYLNATSSGANFGTSSIFHAASATATTAALNLRNNLIVNNSTANGTGLVTCFRRSTTALANYASTSNNNLFYSATGSVMHDGTTAFTMASFKTAVSTRDAASVTEVISNTAGTYFQSFTGSNAGFLHIVNALSTQAESGGAAISGYTDDFDGDTRNATTPDIGADEFAGVPIDATGPSITYTALANSCSTGDAALNGVTITDASGVPTSGALQPRIYFRKGAGAWFSNQGTLASGSGTNGTWNFTITAATMGGLAAADVVSYYVIAQDVAGTPNITSNPAAGLVATDVNTVSTPPTSPNSYTILASLSGTYTVGAAGTFTTLTAAVAAYNSSCIIGAIVFNLIDASYTTGETFPITINNNVASSSSNTLTIKPTLANTVISGSVNGTLIRLNGADYVTIDGSTSGGTDRNLSINNTFGTGTAQAILISSLGAGLGANNNTIKNLNIQAGTTGNGNATYGISVGSTAGATGADNDNTTIQNNVIINAAFGIYAVGTASVSTGGMDNLVVLGNSVTNNSTTVAATIGIQVGNGLNGNITQNTLSILTSGTIQPVGISLETGFVSSTVTRNNITQVLTTATGGYGGRGITVGTGTATSAITIANNFISGVNGSNWNLFGNSSSAGIWIGTIGGSGTLTTTTGGVNLYYNTVSMSGSMGAGSSTALTAALYVGSFASALDIRNNIFSNTQTGTAVGQKNYAIYSAAPNTAFTTINYNDYWVSNSFNAGSAVLGFIGSDRTTLAAVVTGFGQNANSINSIANFISASDLHLVTSTNGTLNAAATPIAGYAIDYDNAARDASTPDIGADEFTPPADDAGATAIVITTPFCAGVQTVQVTIRNFGAATLNNVLVDWTVNAVSQAQQSFGSLALASGASTTVTLGTFNFVAGTTYTIIATTSFPNGNADANTSNDSFSQGGIAAALTGTYTVGAGGNYTTLTLAVADYNAKGLCGATTFSLLDATYVGETYPITFNNNVAGASNTLTIKPTQATTTFTGSSASALLVFNGADYVTVDGSTSAAANTICPASAASRSLTFANTSTSTTSAVIWLQTAASGTNPAATNNTIKNCILVGSGNANTFVGVGSGSTTISNLSLGNGNNNNSFVNNNIRRTQYGIFSQGFSIAVKNTGTVINQNVINTAAANNVAAIGIYAGFENGISISGNVIDALQALGTTTDGFAISLGGIAVSTSTFTGNEVINATITNNTIGSVRGVSTYSSVGIYLPTTTTSGTTLIANNMIYGVNANGTSPDFGAGIFIGTVAGTVNVFYNSVTMTGTLTGGAFPSFAFASAANTTILNIKNNIFTSTGSTGANLNRAMGFGYSTFPNLVSNNNDLFASGTGAAVVQTVNLTSTGATSYTAITGAGSWNAASSQDAASVNFAPNFLSATDLHVSLGTNSALNAAGTPVTVTTDVDCVTRDASTPDIGADEFVPVLDDAAAVNILMPPTFCAGSQPVKVNVQNFGAVNLNTVVVDWTINGVPQAQQSFSGLGGGLGLAPGNTEILLLGNFVFLGSTSYTIVATTSLPNGNADVNTSNDTFTLTGVQTGLLGAYAVGSGGDFATLTAAAAAYNSRSLCGAITFNLIDANYPSETYPITFNNNADASATNALTIKATQAATTITGSSATALIVLNGADYITIDGSTSSTANTVCPASAASRNLTLTNTNVGTSSAVIWLQTAASGTNPAATNNTVKNCNLTGSGVTQTLLGAGSGSSTISLTSLGTGNNSNSYVNNNISGTQYGIYSQGASAAAKNSGTTINQNVINTSASMKGGILTGFENNITISGNTVSNIAQSSSPDVFGITCGFGTSMSTTTIAGNEVTNATITNNTIGSIANTGAFSAYGIGISTSASGTSTIANNMIYGVIANGTGGDFAAGIVLGGGAATTNAFYNTVSMQGTITGVSAATQASACLAITNSTGPTVNIRNNIFTNTQLGNSGATLKLIAIGLVQTTFAGFTCNNNVLYSAGAGPGTYMVGITGGLVSGTARTTLANWQGATGTDAASVSMLPAFVSSTNLRVDGSNFVNGPIDNIGAVVSTTTDIDCATRSVTTPDPGVNEFAVPVCFGTPTAGTASAAPAGPFCNSANTTVSVTGFTSAVGITFQWQASVTGLAGSFSDISGATSSSLVLTGLSTTNYYHCVVTCSFSALSATTNAVGVIVNPNPTVTVTPSAPVLCGPGATALTASGADTYSWSPATGLSATIGASVTATLTSSATYTVTGTTTATGCQGSTNVTVFVAPAATPVTVVATPDPVCQGSVVNLSATVPSGTFTILSENFNGATNSWTTTNTSSGGTPANAAWTLRPNGFTYSSVTFNSNDASQFYHSNSDAQLSGTTATTLVSPAFSTVGLSACNLNFYHYYRYASVESANVEVSTNGTTWNNLATYTSTQGASGAFALVTLSLNGYLNNPTVYVRFKYDATWDWYWAIDNVTVTTPITYTYAWSSDVGGFTSTAAAPTHSPNVNTNYTVTVTNNFGCIGTDNEPVAVIPAPAVFAGPDQNTCGTGPYAITGATAQNTTSVNWTTTGSGTFTGTGTLTPSYSPTGAEIGTSITFYLNGVGNAPCLAATDSLVLTVAPLNTYYLDNDGDGFGNPFLSATGCTAPGGYVTDNTDCNDSNAALNPYTNWYGDFDGDGYGSFIFLTSCTNPGLAGVVQQGGDCDDNNPAVFPGSPEICQNYIDDNCDGQVDENCSGLVNDNRVNAIAVTGSLTSFPTCASISGSCLNAAISPEGSSAYVAAGGGRDVWYKFVAPSPGVQIKLTPSGFNGLIELQTAAGVYVDHENANTAASGLDILNRGGLTTGATYFVAVRNYDNSAGGTFTLCISPLMDSNCDNGSGTYPMCSNLKADYTGANNYTFNFDPTGATTGSNTSGTAVGQIYLTPSAPLNLQYGGTYNVTIDANYTGLVNGLGSADPIVIPGTEICSITLTAQPNVQTKATQLCSAPATLLKGSILQGKPFVCSAINFTLEFTQLNACAGTAIGMPFYGTTTGASASINLSTVAGVTGGGKWYQVRWRPNFASGPGVYGTPSVIFVGGAVMGTSDNAISNADTEKNLQTIEAALYPNPNNGEMLNLNLTNVDAKEVFVRITDGMGKLIYTNLFVVEGSLNTQVRFEKPLSAGLYLVEFIANDESTTLKMIVER